jgi:HAMP domain-containing protein
MRVVLCCAALGGGVGICLAFVAEHISEHYERVLIEEEMNAEIDQQIAQHGNEADADARLPRSAWKSVYIDRPGQPPTSPPGMRALVPGVHELDDDENDSFAAIRSAPIGRVTMIAGLPNSPERERRFAEELLAMILLGIVLGGWLGRMLAGSMLAPVLRLSHEVDRDDPGIELQRIASDHRADEVGALAHALIRYRQRTQLAIEREVLFSADASHELRTPLSVLQGALELLRDNASLSRRVDRMRRSAAEIATLLDALLLIARSDESMQARTTPVELAPALASALAEFRNELESQQIAIGLRCTASARVEAPADLLRVALRLLFRSIASGAFGTRLRLDADGSGIVLVSAESLPPATAAASAADTDARPPQDAEIFPAQAHEQTASTLPRRSDEQGGIGMLRRLCERYGWTLDIARDLGPSTLLNLRFAPPAPASHSG